MIVKWHTFGLYRLCGGHFVDSDILEPGGDMWVIGKAYHPHLKGHSFMPGIIIATNGDRFVTVSGWGELLREATGTLGTLGGPASINGFLLRWEDEEFIRLSIKDWLDAI